MNTRAALEAILFVTEAPVPVEELAEVLEVPRATVVAELEALAADLSSGERGVVLRPAAGGWRLYSHPDAYPFLERFASSATARRISNASLEVLAVIAYRQPVSRGQIAEIRGVDSDSAINTLERLGLVEEAGRLPGPGNPAIYRTTGTFLEKLGINDLNPPELVEVLEETFRPAGS
jgi:segregation and condensation protein B